MNSERSFLYRTINSIVSKFSGKGLGKKYPVLWRVYDVLFRASVPKDPFYHILADSKFMVDPNEPLPHVRKWMQNYMMSDEYEPETTKLVQDLIKEGDIAVDIGASIGYFSMLFSKFVGQTGKVYSFEPTREGFKYLCENRVANDAMNVYPYNYAAWDRDEPVRMPKSTYAANAQWANGMALSEVLNNLGVKSVDFIKLDIDGAEPWALKGLEKIIKDSPNLRMIIEYYPKYIEAADGNPQDVLDMLDKYFTYEEIPDDYGDGYWNYICTRKTE